ncbi:NAD-binding protein [Helcobacillus massiliensis]|uniref:NAD-binding protein n=1 Tax=Helcobacillus massiliensis TaxID=521392 RepID=UPI0021A48F26|nr:NAD-binding protein [Helcobacillus massiliensis]MCT1556623.1 NAD-binding protein [Helcobacillus massiliensis]MCT2035817.1 NAD-binding protein [Helcobacillus massiliensis]MCT2331101.1 NAD-binding protein [Helcobacillus massiliensis]
MDPPFLPPEDRPIELGDANAIVLGMGTVGRAAYRELTEEYGYSVLSVEHDHQRVTEMRASGLGHAYDE